MAKRKKDRQRKSFFFWPLCWLSFFDLWLLITPWYLQTFLHSTLRRRLFGSNLVVYCNLGVY
jgi:hypothetical protein